MPRKLPKPMRFAIVRSLFNAPITHALLDGALRAFAGAGIPRSNVKIVEVPGAFDLPVGALWLAQSKKYTAIVALGCVIRGETPHFEYVAAEAARGLNDVALRTGVPVAFGVLTTDTKAQATARSAEASAPTAGHVGEPGAGNKGNKGNKGYEAAQVALAMARLREGF